MELEKYIQEQLTEAVSMGTKSKINYSFWTTFVKLSHKTMMYFGVTGVDSTDGHSLENMGFKRGPKYIFIGADASNPDAFLDGIVAKAIKYLKGTDKYLIPDMDIIKMEASTIGLDKWNKEKLQEQDKKKEDLFEKIIRNLDDPQIKEVLDKLGRINFDINSKKYGHIMSTGNVTRIYAVKPNATFVATRKQWRENNRIILPNATPIFLKAYIAAETDIVKGAQEVGATQDEIDKNLQIKQAARIAGGVKEKDGSFHVFVYYDVSDTMLIPGFPDRFNEDAGLVDNIQGKFNALAQQILGNTKIDKDELGIKDTPDLNAKFVKVFLSFLEKERVVDFKVLSNLKKLDPSQESTVVSILNEYFNVRYNREHDHSLRQGKVYASTAVVLIANKLAITEVGRIKQITKGYLDTILNSKKDFTEIGMQADMVNGKLQKYMTEGKMIMEKISAEDVMRMLDFNPQNLRDNNVSSEMDITEEEMERQKSEIKENFYKLLNKIGKSY